MTMLTLAESSPTLSSTFEPTQAPTESPTPLPTVHKDEDDSNSRIVIVIVIWVVCSAFCAIAVLGIVVSLCTDSIYFTKE